MVPKQGIWGLLAITFWLQSIDAVHGEETLVQIMADARRDCVMPPTSGGYLNGSGSIGATVGLPKVVAPLAGAKVSASLGGGGNHYDGPAQKDLGSDWVSYRTCIINYGNIEARLHGQHAALKAFPEVKPQQLKRGANSISAVPPKPPDLAKAPKTQDHVLLVAPPAIPGACIAHHGLTITNVVSNYGRAFMQAPEDANICVNGVTTNHVDNVFEVVPALPHP